jgi:hypothetical protein
LLLFLARSFLAAQKAKWVGNVPQRLKNQLCSLWPSVKSGGYSRSGEVAALVMSLSSGLPIQDRARIANDCRVIDDLSAISSTIPARFTARGAV